ncbi:beta-lactamase family protein [Mycobacterium barrassiae]|uniref:serine hydrolase domain-containing protein n=1 Tax=Mycobacterium barrassiae TaxID=319709 RepID=UPI002265D1AB|nr:serine hydrolase domain-containing protein [Mycobacterium barrassiae]MCV7303296.1 beta-lactamase family protein [Mycobacterium barrassiae]
MLVVRRLLVALCVLILTAGCAPGSLPGESTTTTTGTDNTKADEVMRAVRETMASEHLKAVIVRVTVDGKEIVTDAAGESMTGVPATPRMHFRNGAVAISYVATLLLKLVDEQKVSLDDKLSKYLPQIPHADRVTLAQLAQMTSGYVDYVIGNTKMNDAVYANPFRRWTVHELLQFAVSQPLLYEPGTNWNYAHTNYLLLGLALEKATGEEMSKLLSEKVLRPLGLTNTVSSLTPEIPTPVLHAFSSERRAVLKIPPGTPFYEESTFWDPSWTITHGAIQTTDIYDMEATAVGIGSGRLLSSDSYQKMTSTDLRGKTRRQSGCATCEPLDDVYTYGLGVVISGNWLLQNPMLAGFSAVEAYLPAQKIAIAVATTYLPEAFDDQGDYTNAADVLFRRIGAVMAPDDAPPVRAPK